MGISFLKSIKINDYILFKFSLLYFGILSLNIFFNFEISKLFYYIPFLILLLIFLRLFFRLLNLNRSINILFIMFIFLIVLYFIFTFHVKLRIPHFLFLIIFLINVSTAYFVNLSNVFLDKQKIKKFISLLNYVILINLLITNYSIFTQLNLNTRGWVWPTNIALQEIVLLNLIISQLCLIGLKKSLINIILFLIMVFFRESGKAAFFSLSFIVLFYSFYNNVYILKFFKQVIISIIMINFSVLIFGIIFFRGINLNIDSSQNSLLAYVFNKRFRMIYDALINLGQTKRFLFGYGFGFENYILSANTQYNNTPQFLILTLCVYGGIIFALIFFLFYYITFIRLTSFYKNNKRLSYLISSYFFMMIFMLSFHEYFSNPLIYLSFVIFLFSLKIANLNKNSTYV